MYCLLKQVLKTCAVVFLSTCLSYAGGNKKNIEHKGPVTENTAADCASDSKKRKIHPSSDADLVSTGCVLNQVDMLTSDADDVKIFNKDFNQYLSDLNKTVREVTVSLTKDYARLRKEVGLSPLIKYQKYNVSEQGYLAVEANNMAIILNFLQLIKQKIELCALPLIYAIFCMNVEPDVKNKKTEKMVSDGSSVGLYEKDWILEKQCGLLALFSDQRATTNMCILSMGRTSFWYIRWEEVYTVDQITVVPCVDDMIKELIVFENNLKKIMKKTCDRLQKIVMKHRGVANPFESCAKWRDVLCNVTSKQDVAEMYMTGVRLVLFMHSIRQNTRKIIECLKYSKIGVTAEMKEEFEVLCQKFKEEHENTSKMEPDLGELILDECWGEDALDAQLQAFACIDREWVQSADSVEDVPK